MKRMTIILSAALAILAPASLWAEPASEATQSLGQKLDRFSDNLKNKLAEANRRLDDLKAKAAAKEEHAEEEVRARLEQLKSQIDQERTKLDAAETEIKQWAERKKAATAAQIAEWKANHEAKLLEERAETAERNAAASIEIAFDAIDAAEQATLEAWLARRDAIAAEAKRAEVSR